MKANETHIKVERMLRAANWSPLRQFEPRRDDVCIKGEHFEIWRNEKGDKTMMVHFYGEHGVEFYSPLVASNSWSAVEDALKAIS